METTETNVTEMQDNATNTQETAKVTLPTNPEAQAEQNNQYADILNELTSLESEVNTTEDFKTTRKKIVDLKEKTLALYLIAKSDKDAVINKIQNIYEVLAGRQDKIKEELDAKFNENLATFKANFDAILTEVKSLTRFKEAREKLIAVQTVLKDTELRRSDKDTFFATIQEEFAAINERQDKERESFEMECSENYLNIKPKIDDAIAFAKSSPIFKDGRQRLIAIQNELKDLKLKKEQRDELYGLIRAEFDAINQKQDLDRKSFDEETSASWAKIKPMVDEAVEFANTTTDFGEARKKLINVQKEIKDLNLRREQRDELYSAIREIFSKINENQSEERGEFEKETSENFSRLELKIGEAAALVSYSNDFNEIREALIAVQDEIKIVKLTRDQRNELFARIRTSFNEFDKRRNAYSDKRKAEKKDKLVALLANLNQKLDRLKESLAKDTQSLEEQNAHLTSHNSSDNQHIVDNIASIDARIKEKEEKITETENRIADINQEIGKM